MPIEVCVNGETEVMRTDQIVLARYIQQVINEKTGRSVTILTAPIVTACTAIAPNQLGVISRYEDTGLVMEENLYTETEINKVSVADILRFSWSE